jgi:hypothetical protein
MVYFLSLCFLVGSPFLCHAISNNRIAGNGKEENLRENLR